VFGWPIRSTLDELRWPGLPRRAEQAVLSLLFQIEQAQWLPPDELLARQLRQLEALLRHAWATVPFYRQHWRGAYDPAAPLTAERFAALPLLERKHVQGNAVALTSRRPPRAHGKVAAARTSGSSGTPLQLRKSDLNALIWRTLALRDHVWHARDLSGKLGVIRAMAKRRQSADWGQVTRGLVRTGPGASIGMDVGIEEMLRWLEAEQPDYLLTYPSVLRELIVRSGRSRERFARLREVNTLGELLPAELRQLCQEAWGVPVKDAYSAEEVGYIALQCPKHPHYHFQSENVLAEILDPAGKPCRPGGVGRLIVTGLHNFVMPFVRYDIRDYAEAGAPCDCGRGLPVASRIVGRVNNMLVTANGERFWPMFGMRGMQDIAEVRQHQFVQTAFDLVEARLVVERAVPPALEARMLEQMTRYLPPGIRMKIVYVDQIPRTAGGKFEDFVSEVASRGGA
jgi:phenylacetate-CoA ligase